MSLFKKKSRHNARYTKETAVVNETDKPIFNMDFQQYIGQTVTVFLNAGGEVGKGFTGVLMGHTATYIKLLIVPAIPPACSLGNACRTNNGNILFCALCPFNKNASVGSVAVIPVTSIAAFVHNTLGSRSSF